MGIALSDLPDGLRKKVKEADKKNKPVKELKNIDVKAVPHDHRMNKTEANYSGHLEKLLMDGKIIDWKHEPFNLRLAERTFYKPDFVVVTPEGFIEIHEVKGHWRDDALVKIKTAANEFPWFTFKAVRNEKGFWKYRRFKAPRTGFSYDEEKDA